MPSEAMDIDVGQLVYPSLKDCPVVVDLHELSPVGRRATGRRDGRWFERFAEMRQYLTLCGRSHPGLRPLANLRFEVSRLLPAVSSESDVATTPRARKRKLLAHSGHEFGLWCREIAICGVSRSSRRWYLRAPHVRRPHAHQSRHHAAGRHSLLSWAVTVDLSL
jgi:hypothetical protein